MLSLPTSPFRAAGALLVSAALAGCAAGTTASSSAPAALPTPAGAPSPTPSPACEPAPLAERAAATLVVGMPHVTTADQPLPQQLMDLGVGGVFLSEPNVEDADQVRALVDGLRAGSPRPILVSTDEESGRVAVTRAIVGAGPSPRRLAAEKTPEQVRAFAAQIGARLASVGVDLDLAPVLDLDAGSSRGIIGDRSFSADPERASTFGLAFAAGLQDSGVTPTVKHFPGQGRSTTDTHAESATVDASVEELRTTDLVPFQRAIDAGAPVIMLNHLNYAALDGDLPASMSPKTYALLRQMGFRGVAMTDSIGMGAIHSRWDFPEAAVRALEAGTDAVLATDGRQAVRMRDAIVAAVQSGRLPESRLDEAAARVTALAGGDEQALTCTSAETTELALPAAGPRPSTSPSTRPSTSASPRPSTSPSS